MSRQGFRFVHATCLCLDEPLVGAGSLSPEDRALAEDATFRAWERIIETCIAAQADFLLLAGNSFRAETQSLRASVALERGFEKLAAHDISVFIVPGLIDPPQAWKSCVTLSPNVTLLADEDHEPVAVLRNQRVIASISVIATPRTDECHWSANGPDLLREHQAPFHIGLVAAGTPIDWQDGEPVTRAMAGESTAAALLVNAALKQNIDYLALGAGHPRTEQFAHGVAHDPGAAQPLSREERGSHGCSLIDVPSQGALSIDSVKLAPIRWEDHTLNVDRSTNEEDLIERMALTLLEQTPDDDERLWIVHWRLTGEGVLFDTLQETAAQTELWKKLEAELAGEKDVRRLHRLERITVPPPSESDTQIDCGLLAEFTAILEQSSADSSERAKQDLLAHDGLKGTEERLLREVVQQISHEQISRRATQLASRWLR